MLQELHPRSPPSLRRTAPKSARIDVETATVANDRFLYLVKGQRNDTAFATDFPPGTVSVAALENLFKDGLERLFEGEFTQKK